MTITFPTGHKLSSCSHGCTPSFLSFFSEVVQPSPIGDGLPTIPVNNLYIICHMMQTQRFTRPFPNAMWYKLLTWIHHTWRPRDLQLWSGKWGWVHAELLALLSLCPAIDLPNTHIHCMWTIFSFHLPTPKRTWQSFREIQNSFGLWRLKCFGPTNHSPLIANPLNPWFPGFT